MICTLAGRNNKKCVSYSTNPQRSSYPPARYFVVSMSQHVYRVLQFYQWYRDNASAARNADKTQTVGLFANKLVKGLTGFTLRMEALRIIIAQAQWQVCVLYHQSALQRPVIGTTGIPSAFVVPFGVDAPATSRTCPLHHTLYAQKGIKFISTAL